ncbi:MAG: LamG domain-containing protein, partial [Bacteroidota bacterium]
MLIKQYLKGLLAMLLLCSSVETQAQNNALALDGIDDAVTVSGGAGLITSGTGITLTTWVYPTNPSPSFPNFDGIAGIRNNTDADFYILHFTSTSVEARFRNSTGVNYDIVAPVITLNTWVHLAMTYDGTTLSLYKTGVLNASVPASGNISNAFVDVQIGNQIFGTTNYWLAGRVDEVSLWNRALQPSELACIASDGIDTTSATGLKLYYRCNQGVAAGNNAGITSLLN